MAEVKDKHSDVPDVLSHRASWLLYNPQWSDEGEGDDTNRGQEDAESVYSENTLQDQVDQALEKSNSVNSLDIWEDGLEYETQEMWTRFSQDSDSWDAMVDPQGILLTQDGLTVLSNTLNTKNHHHQMYPPKKSQSSSDVTSDDSGSEWDFLRGTSTPKREDSVKPEKLTSSKKAILSSLDTFAEVDTGHTDDPMSSSTTVSQGCVDSIKEHGSFARLSNQLSAIMLEFCALKKTVLEDRLRFYHIVGQQSLKIRSLERKRAEEKKKYLNLVKGVDYRAQHLEGLMVDLARECAVLADQVMVLREEVQIQKAQWNKRTMSVPEVSSPEVSIKHIPLGQRRAVSTVSQQRVGKLTKFFGNEPPLLEMLLSRLGYKQYLAKFQREGITIKELPHITEEQLIQLGIPLGPRQRILDEIQKL